MRRRWLRALGPVRVRTTLAATLVVALALSIGGVALVRVLSASLDHNRRSVAVAQAVNIAGLAASGHLPATLASLTEETTLSQVVDSHNQVIAASANIAGEPPLAPFTPTAQGPTVADVRGLAATDGPSLVVALGAHLGARPVTVFTAVSLEATDAAVNTVILGLVLGLPSLLLLVAVTTWVIVGRALRPIEAIRSEVAEITTHDLHRRVPDPAVDDEVARLSRTMNSMLDRLEISAEQQRRFVADASHELRSPLAAIRAELEVGLARGTATDWPATANDILFDEARMERLVTSLLMLARLEADRRPLPADTVDLSRIVGDEIRDRTGLRGAPVRAEVTPGLRARISGFQAQQIVTNLVDNAQRHARGQVVVTLAPGADHTVKLIVDDDGPGVAPADREVIFERFTRLDESRNHEAGGAGLGLAIVRDIVVRHHGTVAFTDGAVGGRIVVALPAGLDSAATPT